MDKNESAGVEIPRYIDQRYEKTALRLQAVKIAYIRNTVVVS